MKSIEEDLVVGHGDGDVDEAVAPARPYGDRPRVDRAVEPQRVRVLRRGGLVELRRDEREHHGLAAVIAETERSQHVERRLVVAEIRTAETGRTQAAALEELERSRDRLVLARVIERRVIAVHETVDRELDAALRVAPEDLGVALEDARGRWPRRPDAVGRCERFVAIEATRHRRRGRTETRHDLRGPRDRPAGAATLEADGEAHTFSATSASVSRGLSERVPCGLATRVRPARRSTISTYRRAWCTQRYGSFRAVAFRTSRSRSAGSAYTA